MKNDIVKTLVIGAVLSAIPVISGCSPAEESGPIEEETGPAPAEEDQGGDGGEGGGGEEATE
tara:strand:- start:114 stop:299 length:186 start_codon:yes stop_codon:yes gene_type:complete